MTLIDKLAGRRGPRRRPATVRAALAAVTAVAAVAGLAGLSGCGGGTSQVEDFVAERIAAFGDEASTLLADGRKYSVNVLNAQQAIDCTAEPIWVQSVARLYGHVFAECNPDNVAEPKAVMAAAPGARIADLAAQIDGVLAGAGLGSDSLATVMMGANDVWGAYDRFAQDPTIPEAELIAEMRERGEALAVQINRLVARDVRVVVATVPDLGKTPFALAEKEAHDDVDRAALISRLSAALNGRMRINIVNDGRFIGLVLADEMVQAIVRRPTGFGIVNAEGAVCAVALPDCSTATLVTDGRSNTWLWADGRQLAYGGQVRLGLLAQARASNNPF